MNNRRVQDIVRREKPARPGGFKAIFLGGGNISGKILKLFSTRVPFLVGLAAILFGGVFAAKTLTEIVSYKQTIEVMGMQARLGMAVGVPKEIAMMQSVIAFSTSTATSSVATSSVASLDAQTEIVAGLLPSVDVPFSTTTATTAAATTQSGGKTTSKKAGAQAKSATTPTTAAASVPAVITARTFLDATTLSLNERFDGPYEAKFTTFAGTKSSVIWGLDETSIGGSGSVPRFFVSFSCNPPPNIPSSDDTDQNPMFDVRTSYACAIGLAQTSGNDQRVQSKNFSFTTDPGQLIVTSPSAMSTVLQESTDNGGLVFNNIDSNQITITGLNVDISYTALNVADSPLVLRVADDPSTDYHLENLAADPSIPFTHSGENINVPFSFPLGPTTQRMLPIEILGVHRMGISGVDPTITIGLRSVITDRSDSKIVLKSTGLSWSCVVPLVPYDPNATSGPWLTGQACQQ